MSEFEINFKDNMQPIEFVMYLKDYKLKFNYDGLENLWIGRHDGEGGEFDKELFREYLSDCVDKYYKENF